MRAIYKDLGFDKQEFKDYLIKEYKVKSQSEIAKKIGCDVATIENYFKNLGIKTRSYSQAQSLRRRQLVKISEKQRDILNGMLLSDFHINNPHTQSRLTFGFKHKEFAVDLINRLNCFKWCPLYQDKKTGCFHSKTHSYENLNEYHSRWYNNKKKILPLDLDLNGEILYWWFLGDGKLEHRKYVVFCCESFSRKENEILIDKLKDLGLSAFINSQNRIRISERKSIKKFIELIGVCRNECYSYKFDFAI